MDKNYPFSSPKVLCKDNIFHPNIDCNSKQIGLHILNNWSPVLSLNDIIYSVQLLFFEPNCQQNGSSQYINPSNFMFGSVKGNKYKYVTSKEFIPAQDLSPNELQSIILNQSATNLYLKNKQEFESKVQSMIHGSDYIQNEWQCCSRDKHSQSGQIYNRFKQSNKCNQGIVKRAKVLGHRKRNFLEMSLEMQSNRGRARRHCVDDQTVINPMAIKKKQRTHYRRPASIESKCSQTNSFANDDGDIIIADVAC